MHIPAIPDNESQRLQALHGRALLDTPAEERFDRLTRLARNMLGVRIALVSLVDTDRQWFKSRQGLDACETGRDISFCGHAILDDAIFEITDASLDLRFADNPLVTGPPHIRFYAGAPLATAAGYRIGTLCIIDEQPRKLTAAERSALRDLADCVEAEINQIDLQQQSKALKMAQKLGEVIARIQSQFIREADRRRAFEGLLTDVLALTESEYGFVGEVLRTQEGVPYLKSWAITNIAWNDTTRAFYEANAPQGMELTNLKSLFGRALASGEPVIANDPYHDPRLGGLPEGYPALNAFLGIPVHHGGEMVAMLGIANRPGGYDQALIDFLHPLLVTLGQLVEAARVQQRHREGQVELARLSRVASQTTNGVIIADVEGRVEWVNEGFTRITGYTLDEMLGRKPGEVLQGEATDPATVVRMREALQRGEPFDVDVINHSKSGEPYWINISCNPLRDGAGALQGFMAIESDISERKRMERMKSEFVSTVSHELRTPLTSISGALGLIAGGALGTLSEQAQQMVAIAHKNSQRLAYLIDDLLDMEKLMAGKLRFDMQVQLLMPLIEGAIRDNQAYANQHGIRLNFVERADAAEVEVDPQRLQQVLANLLSNAAKFSPEGGVVEVRANLSDTHVRVVVIDHGTGIPDEFRDRIFQKFSQADSSDTRQKGGSGLGLAISKELVERMGGRIGFESVAGEGATFYFELPARAAGQTTGDRA
ncbi:MAG TPA: ATP-binding protein [Thiobacillus sp.]|nr:ATP-binding protein [Thiobacillus sp.]HQT71702.1 ATP-binding protein [Thiobacillus sp.]